MTEETFIDGIGGVFRGSASASGDIFGAIVELNDDGTISESAFEFDNLISYTTFTPEHDQDFLTPMSTQLGAGDYAVVFGSGEFGTTGFQLLSLIQPYGVDESYGDVVANNLGDWYAMEGDNRFRILVSGVVSVPEPATLGIFSAGLMGLIGSRRRSRKKMFSTNIN